MKNLIAKGFLFILGNIFVSQYILANTPTIDELVRPSQFSGLRISPDGNHILANFEHQTQTKLAIMRLKDLKIIKVLSFGKDSHVFGHRWINSTRILIRKAKKLKSFGQQVGYADIIGINIDGSKKTTIFGPKNKQYGTGFITDILPKDDKHILIDSSFEKKGLVNTYKVNVYSGKVKRVSKGVFKNSQTLKDSEGIRRFATYVDDDGNAHVKYRESSTVEWEEIDLYTVVKEDKGKIVPLDFISNDSKVILLSSKEAETLGVYEFDVKSRKKKLIFRNDRVDVRPFYMSSINDFGKDILVGAHYDDGKQKVHYFNEKQPEVIRMRSLEAAFKGVEISITSSTRDGMLMIILTNSDTEAGTYYLFNVKTGQVKFLTKMKPWLKSKNLARMKPIKMNARDGIELDGYLTLPVGNNVKNLPLIVHPHGGPHGVRDFWGYNTEVQFYASLGYAVLQVNFRGSGGYGKTFNDIGHGKWGREMQDDLTDATHWAISQGIADKNRICISGASYGGYASLMGVVREPDLYKCAIGYVGVYDFIDMFERGNVAERLDWGTKYLKSALGHDVEKMKEVSPRYQVAKIKADVLLITGGKDLQAHYKQTFDLQDAFEEIGKDVDVLFYKNEGHGFRDPEHIKVLYTKMKSFLEKNIGH